MAAWISSRVYFFSVPVTTIVLPAKEGRRPLQASRLPSGINAGGFQVGDRLACRMGWRRSRERTSAIAGPISLTSLSCSSDAAARRVQAAEVRRQDDGNAVADVANAQAGEQAIERLLAASRDVVDDLLGHLFADGALDDLAALFDFGVRLAMALASSL